MPCPELKDCPEIPSLHLISLNWWSAVCQKVVAWDCVVCMAVRHYAWPPSRTRKANDIHSSVVSLVQSTSTGHFWSLRSFYPSVQDVITRTAHTAYFLWVFHHDWLLRNFDFVASKTLFRFLRFDADSRGRFMSGIKLSSGSSNLA